ncbi:hypothetical protein L7F22_040702 [Adiantum nelumboides]|nr:hypothetical protein [Adiantum nelumboides]MCO5586760.1 hypothetical protein [Adiantum nelumboides]
MAYFPTIIFHQDTFLPRQDSMCAVCLGDYKEEDLLGTLPQCGHSFHANCIDAWLQQHDTCPVCRMSVQGSHVGGASAVQQSMDHHPTASLTNQPASALGSETLSGESDLTRASMLLHVPSHISGVTLGADDSLVLNVSSSQTSNRPFACGSFHEHTARVDEHGICGGITHCTERG